MQKSDLRLSILSMLIPKVSGAQGYEIIALARELEAYVCEGAPLEDQVIGRSDMPSKNP